MKQQRPASRIRHLAARCSRCINWSLCFFDFYFVGRDVVGGQMRLLPPPWGWALRGLAGVPEGTVKSLGLFVREDALRVYIGAKVHRLLERAQCSHRPNR
jgi:hypothetical protein